MENYNRYLFIYFLFAIIFFLTSLLSQKAVLLAQESTEDFTSLSLEELAKVDAFPKNSLTTHTHLADEWMIGYEFTFIDNNGSRNDTNRISDSQVLEDFPVTPTKMTKEIHMIELMYAPKDYLVFIAMLPFIKLEMDHVTRQGVNFTTKSEGIGDIKVKGLYTIFGDVRRDRHRILIDMGLSFPTGNIDERDDTPAGPNQKLPYPMQLGSGTFDLLPGLIYLGQTEKFQWGAELNGVIRLGENSNDYSLGNRGELSLWGGWKLTNWLSPFVELDGQLWGNIDGADPDLDPNVVPTADPDRRAGSRIDLLGGINIYISKTVLKGMSFGIEAGFPVYQDIDGPQLETDWLLNAVWSWTWIF